MVSETATISPEISSGAGEGLRPGDVTEREGHAAVKQARAGSDDKKRWSHLVMQLDAAAARARRGLSCADLNFPGKEGLESESCQNGILPLVEKTLK
jgi:hypothetical protein